MLVCCSGRLFSVNVEFDGLAAEARKLMSEEHKALGHRPPPDSLAAQAQAAAAKHPQGAAAPTASGK